MVSMSFLLLLSFIKYSKNVLHLNIWWSDWKYSTPFVNEGPRSKGFPMQLQLAAAAALFAANASLFSVAGYCLSCCHKWCLLPTYHQTLILAQSEIGRKFGHSWPYLNWVLFGLIRPDERFRFYFFRVHIAKVAFLHQSLCQVQAHVISAHKGTLLHQDTRLVSDWTHC